MKKGMALLLCLLLAAGMLSGCADAKEIDDTSFILSLGVDKGTEKTYEISFQLPVLAEEDSPSFRTIVCQAEGLSDAVALLNANTPYRVDFTHLNFLVIGRALAEEGVGQIIDPLMRMPQVRKGAMVIVAQDTAKEFVQSLQSDENLNLMQLQQSIISEAGTSGIFPNFTLDMFYDSLYEQRGAAVVALGMQSDEAKKPNSGSAISELPGYTMVESSIKSELIGSAVFNDDRMVGTLTGEQTRVWCMATGQFGHGEITPAEPLRRRDADAKIKAGGACKDNGKHGRRISQCPDRGTAQCVFGGLCRNGKLRNAGQKGGDCRLCATAAARGYGTDQPGICSMGCGWVQRRESGCEKFQNAAGLGRLSMAGEEKTAAGDRNAQRLCVPVPSGVRRGTMIAVLVCLGLIGYCGGYALRQFREKKAGAGWVLSALCLADAALLAWLITL